MEIQEPLCQTHSQWQFNWLIAELPSILECKSLVEFGSIRKWWMWTCVCVTIVSSDWFEFYAKQNNKQVWQKCSIIHCFVWNCFDFVYFFFSVSLNIKIQFDKSVFCTLIIIYLKLVNNFGVDWIVDWQQFFQPFNNDRECASENERQQPKRNWCSCIHQTLDDARVTHINQIQTNRR